MNITLIAAIGLENELGKDNDLIWHIPEDLKFFRENTMSKTIVMGLNTFNSLPRLLPNRKHIVLTRRNIEIDSSVKNIKVNIWLFLVIVFFINPPNYFILMFASYFIWIYNFAQIKKSI